MRFQIIAIVAILVTACSPQPSAVDTAASPTAQYPLSVVEATYGANCKDFVVPAPGANTVAIGNATAAVVAACANKTGACDFVVDVGALGDPAPVCAKEFDVKWNCGSESRSAHLDGEANTGKVTLACN